MKLNPRTKAINNAKVELRIILHGLSESHDLTTNELMQILTETTYQMFRNLVREEQQSEE